MLKRCLTGAVIVIVLAGFFLLRTIDIRLFNILIYFFSIAGTFEMYRATKQNTMMAKDDKYSSISIVSCIILLLATVLFVSFYTFFGIISVVCLLGSAIILLLIIEAFDKKRSVKKYFRTLLVLLYPNLLLLTMLVANSFKSNSMFVMLLIFIISPLADTFAYFVGSLIGGKKLCPKISPKKTISGAVGGIIGGTIGAIILYFIMNPSLPLSYPILFIITLGIVGSIFTEAGDLFESYIKRKVSIKDMGKILPGHGGILDRIDGILFTSTFITIVFLFL